MWCHTQLESFVAVKAEEIQAVENQVPIFGVSSVVVVE